MHSHQQKQHDEIVAGCNRAYPRIWLMTDPRIDDILLRAVQALPMGSGIIFRHYHLEQDARHGLFMKIRHICKRRGHSILIAGDERLSRDWGADGFHGRTAPRSLSKRILRSAPVHDRAELRQALRHSCHLLFISPIYPTRSHPKAKTLGILGFTALANQSGSAKAIALGGMNRTRAAMLDKKSCDGWAGIDAFMPQKRGA